MRKRIKRGRRAARIARRFGRPRRRTRTQVRKQRGGYRL